jgi:hypothetical protein
MTLLARNGKGPGNGRSAGAAVPVIAIKPYSSYHL